MMRNTRLISILCGSLMLAGCATAQRPAHNPSYTYSHYQAPCDEPAVIENVVLASNVTGATCHTVKPGETLWGISKMYSVDLDSLARINSISDKRTVAIGRVLTIPRAVVKTAEKPRYYASPASVDFAWPVSGTVKSRFGEKVDQSVNKGIDIAAPLGRDVRASLDGRVVYCDLLVKGFGQTVIVDHANGYQTVYSYNSDILVKVGDEVRQGQPIAKAGQSGRAKEPMLHFEIRRNGEPQDPMRLLRQ